MGDPAGELAEALQPLGLVQVGFEPLAFGLGRSAPVRLLGEAFGDVVNERVEALALPLRTRQTTSSIGNSAPSLRTALNSMRWPSRRGEPPAHEAGEPASVRLAVPLGDDVSASTRPRTSRRDHPNNSSALRFHSVTIPAASMLTKASVAVAMIASVLVLLLAKLTVAAFKLACGFLGAILRGLGRVPGPPGLLAPLAFDRVPDRPGDRFPAPRSLDQVVLRAGIQRPHCGLLIAQPGHDDDGQLAEAPGQRDDRVELLGVRQRQIHERHVGALAIQALDGVAQRAGGHEGEAQIALPERVLAQQNVIDVVLDEKHPQRRQPLGRGAGVHGPSCLHRGSLPVEAARR